jgi:hypothetical protein
MMLKHGIGTGLAAALMILLAGHVSALTVEIHLNRENVRDQKYSFQVTSVDRANVMEFAVTVTPKKEKLSAGLLARLYLSDGKTDLATVPVEEKRDGDKVAYWFRVAPDLLSKTRFEFSVLSGNEEKDANWKTRFVAKPGTLEYWFYVGDFLAPKITGAPVAAPSVLASHRTESHNQWLAQRIEELRKIKVGMTRREVEKLLQVAPASFYYASSRDRRGGCRYEHPICSYIQVDVEYKLARDTPTATHPDDDMVSRVSQPIVDLVSNKSRF